MKKSCIRQDACYDFPGDFRGIDEVLLRGRSQRLLATQGQGREEATSICVHSYTGLDGPAE